MVMFALIAEAGPARMTLITYVNPAVAVLLGAVVLNEPIPDKGRVLTGLSGFWFARTREIVPNHLLALRPDGRSTEAKRLQMLPIECVVRGYLAGSG